MSRSLILNQGLSFFNSYKMDLIQWTYFQTFRKFNFLGLKKETSSDKNGHFKYCDILDFNNGLDLVLNNIGQFFGMDFFVKNKFNVI